MSRIESKQAKVEDIERKLLALKQSLEGYLGATRNSIDRWYQRESIPSATSVGKKPKKVRLCQAGVDTLKNIKCCNHLTSEVTLTQEKHSLAITELLRCLLRIGGIKYDIERSLSHIFKGDTVTLKFWGTNGVPGKAVFRVSTDELLCLKDPY